MTKTTAEKARALFVRMEAKKAPKRRCLKLNIFRITYTGDWMWDLRTWNGKLIAESAKAFRTKAAAIKETDMLIDETAGATQYVDGVELEADEE